MPYSDYTDLVLPYHVDGTVVKWMDITVGVLDTLDTSQSLELNDEDYTAIAMTMPTSYKTGGYDYYLLFFFPELVDVTAFFVIAQGKINGQLYSADIDWSDDSTNGLDGTWTAATLPSGQNALTMNLDSWRTGFKQITGISGASVIRLKISTTDIYPVQYLRICHLYGHKHAGETPDDILFLDPDDSDNEYVLPMDFGDVPTASSSQRKVKFHNDSGSLTASTIEITVVDPDDLIRIGVTNTGPWLTTQSIASLGPGATSSTYYVKCEAPSAPAALGPNRAPITCVVGSWA